MDSVNIAFRDEDSIFKCVKKKISVLKILWWFWISYHNILKCIYIMYVWSKMMYSYLNVISTLFMTTLYGLGKGEEKGMAWEGIGEGYRCYGINK